MRGAGILCADGIERGIREGLRRDEVVWAAIDVERRTELGEAALRERRRRPSKQQRFCRLGRGVDNDGAAVGKQLRQFRAQILAQLVVEIGERFVEENQVGFLHDGPRKSHALLLPAGKFERLAVQVRLKAHQLRDPRDLALDRGV